MEKQDLKQNLEPRSPLLWPEGFTLIVLTNLESFAASQHSTTHICWLASKGWWAESLYFGYREEI